MVRFSFMWMARRWALLAPLLVTRFAMSAGGRLMAMLPPDTVPGISATISVYEDLADPGSPIRFEATGRHWAVTKSGDRVVPADPAALWGGRTSEEVLRSPADLLGNAFLPAPGPPPSPALVPAEPEPSYLRVAKLVPPVLARSEDCGDYDLGQQSFVGSRIAADKAAFGVGGKEHMSFTRQE